MGFHGLEAYEESDNASDLVHQALDSMIPILRNGLKKEDNGYNTRGPENVGLFFEAFICPITEHVMGQNWEDFGREVLIVLNRNVKALHNWTKDKSNDPQDVAVFINAYRRMIKNITKWLSIQSF